jgi:acyl carrier protein
MTADSLRAQLAAMSRPGQDQMLLALVRTHTAGVLGYPSPEAVEPTRAFTDLGFDSLMAVDLRNRLGSATGLKLPTTLIFEYSSSVALAGYLQSELVQDGPSPVPLARELDNLGSLLSGTTPDDATYELVAARLQELLSAWVGSKAQSESQATAQKIESASDEEIFDFIHNELGRSASE